MPLKTQGTPQDARWQISFDSDAQFRSAKLGVIARRAIYLGERLNHKGSSEARFATPAETQPTTFDFQYFTPTFPGESSAAYEARKSLLQATAHRKVDVPVIFEDVLPGAEQ